MVRALLVLKLLIHLLLLQSPSGCCRSRWRLLLHNQVPKCSSSSRFDLGECRVRASPVPAPAPQDSSPPLLVKVPLLDSESSVAFKPPWSSKPTAALNILCTEHFVHFICSATVTVMCILETLTDIEGTSVLLLTLLV